MRSLITSIIERIIINQRIDFSSKEALERLPWEVPTLRREPLHDRLSTLRTRFMWGVQAEAGESGGSMLSWETTWMVT